MQTIYRIKIAKAGLLNVNGNYDVCKSLSKFPTVPSIEKTAANHHRHRPEFLYMHLAKDQKGKDLEFAIYLQPLPEMGFGAKTLVWVLARINLDGDNKSEPIILYFAPRRNGNVPPPAGWKPVGGIEPVPKAELIELTLPKKKDVASPLKKAIDEANKDEKKMKELMFDLDEKSNRKNTALYKGDKRTAKIVNISSRKHHIVQPAASKDMRKVRGEWMVMERVNPKCKKILSLYKSNQILAVRRGIWV